jgi:mRNA interferase MazF
VVVQDDRFAAMDSITVCPVTSDPTEMSLFRPVILPSEANGLRRTSRVMADKITTLPKLRVRDRIGRLSEEDMLRLNSAVLLFLGLTD